MTGSPLDGSGTTMSDGPTPPRWFIVVQSEKLHLFEDLHRSFAYDLGVQVILDRRKADRRRHRGRVRPEQRRRQPPQMTEVAFGQKAGFVLVVRP